MFINNNSLCVSLPTLAISQFYKLGLSNTLNSRVVAGAQDNGTEMTTNGVWDAIRGADGILWSLFKFNSFGVSSFYINNKIFIPYGMDKGQVVEKWNYIDFDNINFKIWGSRIFFYVTLRAPIPWARGGCSQLFSETKIAPIPLADG